VIIGMALAAIVARSLDDMLYSVTARDPLTFTVVTALLITVAVAGSYVPARRAMRVDPLVTLRHE
jgi:putative ABC transport system permease protein